MNKFEIHFRKNAKNNFKYYNIIRLKISMFKYFYFNLMIKYLFIILQYLAFYLKIKLLANKNPLIITRYVLLMIKIINEYC